MNGLLNLLFVLVLALAVVACRKDAPEAPKADTASAPAPAVPATPQAAPQPRPADNKPASVDLQITAGPAPVDLKPTDPNAKFRVDDLVVGGAPANAPAK